jgi:hypothetical protein
VTKEELAALLNGREYMSEITPSEERTAAKNKLLVVFGASDDNCELRGVINDEVSAWYGCTFSVSRDGKLLAPIEGDDTEILEKYDLLDLAREMRSEAKAIVIDALWDKGDYSWVIQTNSPNAAFDILDDGEKFCRGIVIDMKECQ